MISSIYLKQNIIRLCHGIQEFDNFEIDNSQIWRPFKTLLKIQKV